MGCRICGSKGVELIDIEIKYGRDGGPISICEGCRFFVDDLLDPDGVADDCENPLTDVCQVCGVETTTAVAVKIGDGGDQHICKGCYRWLEDLLSLPESIRIMTRSSSGPTLATVAN